MRATLLLAATAALASAISALADETAAATCGTTTSTWQDDDEVAVDLDEALAGDEDAACEVELVEDGDAFVDVQNFAARMEEGVLWVGLNGASSGLLFRPASMAARCLGTLAEVAASSLLRAESAAQNGMKKSMKTSAVHEPKRIVTATGKPVAQWEAAVSARILHVLLDREAWVWPAVQVGFTRRIAGTELVTVSVAPRVFLAKNVVNDGDITEIIKVGSKSLYRSPEKHYSDDDKYKNYRTSETGNLRDSHPPSRALRRRAWQLLRLQDLEMVETLQLLRYTPGKWYKEHFDVFHNLQPLTSEDELVELHGQPRDLVRWAELQRYLLWRVFTDSAVVEDAVLAQRMRALYVRPNDASFPRVGNDNFDLKNYEGDVLDLHISWLRSAFCDHASSPTDSDACTLHAAEALDAVFDAYPKRPRQLALMRNRHVTMLPYLTDVEEGGETVFPHAKGESLYGSANALSRDGMSECSRGVFVPPVKGGAAIFYHLHPSMQSIDRLSMHGGCPPVRGVKYAINIFCWNLPSDDGSALLRAADK